MGKIIVITGAGIGLGRALARSFVKDGDSVVLLGRTFSKVKDLADELGSAALAVECDVSSPDSVREAFATIAKTHPKIDVLINNAAIYEPAKVANLTDDQILTAVMTNFSGPIFCARAAIPMMDRGGYIINVSSESVALEFPMLAMYQSTKAGMERFGQTLSQELEPDGIRVTTVRAGPMYEEGKTPGWEPEIAMQFHQACLAVGIDLRNRGISHVNSIPPVFRALIDLPADVRITNSFIEGRRP